MDGDYSYEVNISRFKNNISPTRAHFGEQFVESSLNQMGYQ